MKIALIYPPPWKIGAGPVDGPPAGYREGDLDADFHQTPYGLFAIGAECIRAGHQTKVLNLSAFRWQQVEEVIAALDADVFGMSCWTANRRGVRLVADLVKSKHPSALVVVGGPHATPLGPEIMKYFRSVDLVCVGESDRTFLDIVGKKERGEPLLRIPGTVYRDHAERAHADGAGPRPDDPDDPNDPNHGAPRIVTAPERKNVQNLDDLASPHHFFDTHILMTSRGCPWNCTFCGAETSWGRGFRANSNEYVLDAMESVSKRLPVKMIQIKDDTFTTNKKRVLGLCKEMQRRNLGFFWSCDTRVDVLSDELLREMRLAGCQRISLGVESGSQKILDLIDKKITPQEILDSTQLAKKYGIKIRYYMMLGNRGETRETFQETLAFLEKAAPHEYVFSCLSVYPGTRDFHDAEKAGWLKREQYFTEDFQELKTPFDASDEDIAWMNEWFFANKGLRVGWKDGVAEYRAILERLGDYHGAHMDLGAALYHEGDLDGAERHVRRAMELGYPCPGLAYNHLACIAKARGDLDAMMDLFMTAAKTDPQHWVLIQNVNAARAWFKEQGPARGLPLELQMRHDFQLLERTAQPTLPGPLPDDFAVWKDTPLKGDAAPRWLRTPDTEGSGKGLKKHLDVLRD